LQILRLTYIYLVLVSIIQPFQSSARQRRTKTVAKFNLPGLVSRSNLLGILLCFISLTSPSTLLANPSTDVVNNANTPNHSKPELPTCVYIASYAPGYAWQDGIDRALKQQLNQACSVKTFYKKKKKILDIPTLEQLGLNAKAFIDSHRPNVVIVSDDDAVKYVLQRHYRNHTLPFVFCGLNNGGEL